MAHPDDEIIFGFGVLPYTKKIIICSNDRLNWKKEVWMNRCRAFEQVGKILNIEVISLDNNSDFYALEGEKMNILKKSIFSLIEKETVIFTHNAWGEYGHKDHIFVHNFAKEIKKEVLVSNIMITDDYTRFTTFELPPILDYLEVTNDLETYFKCENIYKNWRVWTWNQPPIKTAKIYYDK